jgi:hypothetical protein
MSLINRSPGMFIVLSALVAVPEPAVAEAAPEPGVPAAA